MDSSIDKFFAYPISCGNFLYLLFPTALICLVGNTTVNRGPEKRKKRPELTEYLYGNVFHYRHFKVPLMLTDNRNMASKNYNNEISCIIDPGNYNDPGLSE